MSGRQLVILVAVACWLAERQRQASLQLQLSLAIARGEADGYRQVIESLS